MAATRLTIPEDPTHQPDTKIYLKDVKHTVVAAWSEQVLGPCGPWQEHGQTLKHTARDRHDAVHIAWPPKAVGKRYSLFLESDNAPQDDDLVYARAAHTVLGVETRCVSGGREENQGEKDADRWLRVDAEGTEEITRRIA